MDQKQLDKNIESTLSRFDRLEYHSESGQKFKALARERPNLDMKKHNDLFARKSLSYLQQLSDVDNRRSHADFYVAITSEIPEALAQYDYGIGKEMASPFVQWALIHVTQRVNYPSVAVVEDLKTKFLGGIITFSQNTRCRILAQDVNRACNFITNRAATCSSSEVAEKLRELALYMEQEMLRRERTECDRATGGEEQ